MADLPQDLTHEFEAVLSALLPWHRARISFLDNFPVALLKVRSVNLVELAAGCPGKAKIDLNHKRLQRFRRTFYIDEDSLAHQPLDCTGRRFGEATINLLLFGVDHQGK